MPPRERINCVVLIHGAPKSLKIEKYMFKRQNDPIRIFIHVWVRYGSVFFVDGIMNTHFQSKASQNKHINILAIEIGLKSKVLFIQKHDRDLNMVPART